MKDPSQSSAGSRPQGEATLKSLAEHWEPAEIGARIRALRRQRSLTLSDVAARASIAPSYLSMVETADRRASLELLQRICEAIGITLETLGSDAGALSASRVVRTFQRYANKGNYRKLGLRTRNITNVRLDQLKRDYVSLLDSSLQAGATGHNGRERGRFRGGAGERTTRGARCFRRCAHPAREGDRPPAPH